MARQNHEITKVQPLLDKRGNLLEPGWSRKMVQQYHRQQQYGRKSHSVQS